MIGKFLLTFWIILRWTSLPGNTVIGVASAHGWPASLLDESLDEKNDVEIFRAVVESMIRWEQHRKSSHRSKREASRVCYEDVGCFEDTGPFGYLEMLPSPPEDVGTRFLVYGSRRARSIPTEVPANEIGERVHRAIDPELPTKVIVHGFGSGCEHIWVYEMRSALMAVHECNVICVDWGPGSAVPNYVRAAANTRLVGRQLAKLIRSLDVPLERIHLIGFSLGAHVAGFAGAELGNVSRITGLDPAGPLFESQDPRARLDETDAHFVDVIHSNGEQLILGGLGSWQPMGDVDFYPNGGRMQTGCSNLFLGAVSDIIWSASAIEGRSLCNHRRAYKLFTDSVSPKCRFPAFTCEQGYESLLKGECFPCDNSLKPCGLMGYYSDTSPARGQLYLVTREEEPFCAHQYLIKVYNSLSERPARSYGSLKVTLVGEGTLNETFAMTKKDDEELLVGAVLKKIIVPHPAITDIEGVEVKYTAYSGWISSGLVSWSIDKIVLVDSFGQTLSVCNKGLTLESNRPVFLPLYPGECNVPETAVEPITNSTAPEAPEKFVDGQIGSTDSESGDDVKPDDKVTPNLWPTFDLSNDGNSNSLDHNEVSGRGFSSGSSSSSSGDAAAAAASPLTLENSPKPNFITERGHSEIQEPVLRPTKKETGRSLRLGEITEPILGPRSSKRNIDIFKIQDSARRDEILEASSSSSRSFTVQFLPEKLAGILAQAERYARHTLLPLISRYTPSFVGGSRDDQPKYFPLLSEFNAEEGRSNNAEAKLEVTTDETKIVKILKNSTSAEEESNTFDWVPITEPKLTVNESPETTSENAIVAEKTSDRVFIPFVNLEESEVSTSKEVASNETVVPDKAKGIQEGYEAEVEAEGSEERDTSKKKVEDTGNDLKAVSTRSMIFPYVYERSKDPRTRYIPLIPEEDFGRSTNIFEKFR